jgi:hypothetical protein
MSPAGLLNDVARINPFFDGYSERRCRARRCTRAGLLPFGSDGVTPLPAADQHDAQEFVRCFLDILNDGLCARARV